MYRNQDAHAGPGQQQYQHSASSASSFGFSPFSATMQGIMSTNFDSPQHLSPSAPLAGPRPLSRSTPERQGHARNKSGSLSPHIGKSSPLRNSSSAARSTDRSLPSRDVTAETLSEAYVSFILYCNPQILLDVDTTTLRMTFQSPPKSDNKDFDVYRLYELIRQFDAKEIKTWAQLVMELGVEAPDTAKGQSVQKVQQYSVRLKRWMRAMHIDAFFEYLMNKQHAYFLDIPSPNEPYAPMRDGVPPEEDLAIRALDPSLRPKRGRRRNSEVDAEENAEASRRQASMAPQSAIPASAYPSSALPRSAHPDGASGDPWAIASAVTPQSFAPWDRNGNGSQSAVNTSAPSQLRWQIHGASQGSSTPHPLTAHPASTATRFEGAFESEPKSAITPSSRKRRKHGPAVSSAWNASSAPGAKPRGRPPASRNVQDGPFTTFPADPANDKGSMQTYQAPQARMDVNPEAEEPQPAIAPPPLTKRHSDGPLRPGRLSLQVPAHTGRPVRLATPPRVLVNGETNESERALTQSPIGDDPTHPQSQPPELSNRRPLTFADKEMPGFAYFILKRALATDLLRADLIGRAHRLTGDEAQRLAEAVLDRFHIPVADGTTPKDDIARLTAASWLGLGEHMNVPLGPACGHTKRLSVTRFRVDPAGAGYEELVPPHAPPAPDVRDVFDLSWTVSMGGCNGNFSLAGLRLAGAAPKVVEDSHDALLTHFAEAAKVLGVDQPRIDRAMRATQVGARGAGEEVDWKSRYMAMEFSSRVAKGELDRVKERIIEKILEAVM